MTKIVAVLTSEERKVWEAMYPGCVPNRKDAWYMMSESFPRLRDMAAPNEPPKKRRY